MNGLHGKCRELVAAELDTREPLEVINQILIPILDAAGQDFEAGVIFIPQLMLCASTAQVAFEVVKERIQASRRRAGGQRHHRGGDGKR